MFAKTPVRADVVELVSPQPIDQCCQLLELAMDRPMTMFGHKQVVGAMTGSKLRARKRIGYRNSFQTYLSARLIKQGETTCIQCRFSMHPAVIAFMAVWFTGVILIGGSISVVSLLALASHPSHVPPGTWQGILIPIAMLVFGCGLVGFGRYIARDERQFLIAFVCTTLGIAPKSGSA